jgi:hypothetical protein
MTVTHLMMHQQQFVVLGVVIVTRDAFALNPTPMMLTHWNDLNYWTFGIRSDDCPRHVLPLGMMRLRVCAHPMNHAHNQRLAVRESKPN